MSNNPITGAGYFLKGLSIIRQKGLRRFVAVPLLVNVLVFGGAIYVGVTQLRAQMDRLTAWLPDWLDWLTWLIWPLFAIAVLLVVFYGFSLLANLIAAPFNGLLSEAVERKLTGRTMDAGGWKKLLKDFVDSLRSELRKLLYFAVRALPLLLLFVIPLAQVAAPVLWLLFSAWMLALEYVDYPMANHGIVFSKQRSALAGRRLLTLGFGATTMLALMVPVFNFFVMPAAVAGATAMWVEQFPDAAAGRLSTDG